MFFEMGRTIRYGLAERMPHAFASRKPGFGRVISGASAFSIWEEQGKDSSGYGLGYLGVGMALQQWRIRESFGSMIMYQEFEGRGEARAVGRRPSAIGITAGVIAILISTSLQPCVCKVQNSRNLDIDIARPPLLIDRSAVIMMLIHPEQPRCLLTLAPGFSSALSRPIPHA